MGSGITANQFAAGTIVTHTARTEWDHADIKSIPDTHLTVVPAPGANKIVLVTGGMAILDASAGGYDAGSSDAGWQLTYETESGGYASDVIYQFGTAGGAGASDVVMLPIHAPGLRVGSGDMAGFLVARSWALGGPNPINKAVHLFDNDNNGGSDYTGGHLDNTLIILAEYRIFNVVTGLYE